MMIIIIKERILGIVGVDCWGTRSAGAMLPYRVVGGAPNRLPIARASRRRRGSEARDLWRRAALLGWPKRRLLWPSPESRPCQLRLL